MLGFPQGEVASWEAGSPDGLWEEGAVLGVVCSLQLESSLGCWALRVLAAANHSRRLSFHKPSAGMEARLGVLARCPWGCRRRRLTLARNRLPGAPIWELWAGSVVGQVQVCNAEQCPMHTGPGTAHVLSPPYGPVSGLSPWDGDRWTLPGEKLGGLPDSFP